MSDKVTDQVADFIKDNFLFREDLDGLSGSDSLLELGIIDSTGVLELVAFLEEGFDLEVGDAEIVPENLDSINAIAAFVTRKQDLKILA